ncbi:MULTISPECIES: DUF3617 family protein [unclassified Sphingomonas]|jgi:hypothetical protein|uniref:DUF3617 domain-containing protein n=1 Tax=Sphingomonas TaxID=13687 RepID=UPI0009649D7E|nr:MULTISPECIES: DUF3617 family protein [unclassified Sphingomonas]MBN8813576.1 DUF3617 family protein [Sphingomonas sp.]OJY52304.1 MAG: hypothetical protein BGP17_07820 [Sphingomonas sp. 67-41]
MTHNVGYVRAARRIATLSLLLPCLLGGCGQEDAASANAGAGSTAQPALQGFSGSLRPGLYKIVQTGDADEETERCITAETLAKGGYVAAKDVQPGWTVVRNRASGGVIDFEAHGPAKGRMSFKGSYTAAGFTLDAVLGFEHKGQPMTLENHQVGTFLSADCGEVAE